jgi:hypothetical protein
MRYNEGLECCLACWALIDRFIEIINSVGPIYFEVVQPKKQGYVLILD